MARIIGVMGESGSGKTTSMRNLDPETTLYIDCDKKGLSWKGWREQYNPGKQNYLRTDDQMVVMKALGYVDKAKQYEGFKTVVVDTLNGIMVADEMRRMKEKGYDKWQDLAVAVYGIIDLALTIRDDVTVIFLCHTQTEHDDSGYTFTRIKTSGKKLDKVVLESKFPVVLLAKANDGRYIFETKAKLSTAKVPMGAIDEDEIENDITKVITALEGY